MTEKHDAESYLGNINLKAAGVQTEFTKEQIEEYAKCVADPMYFIENFVKIVSLDEGLVQFEPYDYQKKMIHSMHNDRFVIAKLPRQSGKVNNCYFVFASLCFVQFSKECCNSSQQTCDCPRVVESSEVGIRASAKMASAGCRGMEQRFNYFRKRI